MAPFSEHHRDVIFHEEWLSSPGKFNVYDPNPPRKIHDLDETAGPDITYDTSAAARYLYLDTVKPENRYRSVFSEASRPSAVANLRHIDREIVEKEKGSGAPPPGFYAHDNGSVSFEAGRGKLPGYYSSEARRGFQGTPHALSSGSAGEVDPTLRMDSQHWREIPGGSFRNSFDGTDPVVSSRPSKQRASQVSTTPHRRKAQASKPRWR